MSPEISILLPVYNGARFLEAQARSLLDQTFADLEILAYDDDSTDGSRAILERLAAEDRRLTVTAGDVNLGQNAALRRLLASARGRFIAFSDQDDVWHPEKLARLHAAIGGNGLAYGCSRLTDAAGRETGRSILDLVASPIVGRDEARILLHNSISGHAMLVRRHLVDPVVFTLHRPYDWLIAGVATFSLGIVLVPEAITWHRIHGGNLINEWMLTGKRSHIKRHRGWRHGLMLMQDSLRVLATHDAVPPQKRRIFEQMNELVRDELGHVLPGTHRLSFVRRFMRLVDRLDVSEATRAGILDKIRRLRPPVAGTLELALLGRWR